MKIAGLLVNGGDFKAWKFLGKIIISTIFYKSNINKTIVILKLILTAAISFGPLLPPSVDKEESVKLDSKHEGPLIISPNPVVDEFWIEDIEPGTQIQFYNEQNELVHEVIAKPRGGFTGNVGGINPILYKVVANGRTGKMLKIDGQCSE